MFKEIPFGRRGGKGVAEEDGHRRKRDNRRERGERGERYKCSLRRHLTGSTLGGRSGEASLGSISLPQTPPCYPNLSRRQEMELSPRHGTCDWTSLMLSPPGAPPANLSGSRAKNSRATDPGSANASTQSISLSMPVSDTLPSHLGRQRGLWPDQPRVPRIAGWIATRASWGILPTSPITPVARWGDVVS